MTNLGVLFTLIRREQRGRVQGMYVFLASLVLGVAAIAGVGSVNSSVTAGLKANGQRILGGDIELRLSQRGAARDERLWLAKSTKAMSEVIKMRAMASPKNAYKNRALVELKAVDHSYPLNSEFIANPEKPLSELLEKKNGAWGAVVDASLLSRLNLQIGDHIKVGNIAYHLRATVVKEPDRIASMFSFGPRLLVAHSSLFYTGLVQPGSQIQYYFRLLLPSSISYETWVDNLNITFPQAGWRIRGADNAAPGVQRFLDRMNLFFGFVGLTVLLIGGIGIANTVTTFLNSKITTIAALKCVGASGNFIFLLYFAQVMILGIGGVSLGCIIGSALPFGFETLVGPSLPVRPVAAFYTKPIALAAIFGLITTGIFTIWPIGRAREVSASVLFRDHITPIIGRPKPCYLIANFIGVFFLICLILGTSTDWYFASWFIAGVVVTFGLLILSAKLVKLLATLSQEKTNATLRMALANLHRPGATTFNVILSMGLGLSVLAAISLIEKNLSTQITKRLPNRAPAFFFIDIQPHQIAAFDAALSDISGTSGYKRVPTLRGRVVKIAGIPVESARVSPEAQWAIRGDRVLTYAAKKRANTKITKGQWWGPSYRGPPLISLDAGLARGFGIDIGDTLGINIMGREVTAKIANVREINWRSLQFDFAIIFAPGTLESAPHSYVAAIEAPKSRENDVEIAATEKFPNVSAIRVRDALKVAANILAGIGGAVKGTAILTLLAGTIVLAGSFAANRRRRIYESVVFKVLGATRWRLATVFILEYGFLGLITGLLAASFGTISSWAVVKFLLHMEWTFVPGTLIATLIVCTLVTLLVGFLETWRTFSHSAAPFLRNK